uniref:Phenylethanolamine N-methyltransferase n=1 Tax=Sander lucioperca TaxID=283035 RepID=A0A8D0ARH6_SANLU
MEEKGAENGVAAMAACYQGFDPAEYLQSNYTPPRADFERKDILLLLSLSLTFPGDGPTLYQVMSGSEELLQDEGGCSLDWTPFLQHVCKLEGRRPSAWTEKAARLRQVIVDIVPIDVNRPQPLAHDALPSAGADCLVSCFCLESAFTRALGHIGRLLRPGGHLLLIGTLGMSYYMAGAGVKIPTVPVNEAQVCASLKESGYTLIRLEVYTLRQDMNVGTDDAYGVFFVKAMKE